jgi:2-polyprenyl-6-methoxyphenol hydroxylase-like FAD-dependent oxidoreductase
MNVGNDLLSSEKVYDVLIVGAGPVGLATAIALRKRGINNILVIDQTREFRRVGQVVDLLPNGLKALKYIDVDAYQQVRGTTLNATQQIHKKDVAGNPSEIKGKQAPSNRVWHHKNLQGKIIRSVPLDFEIWFERYGEGRVSIAWFDLQTKLRSLLPPEIVQINHRCINVEEEAAWVRIDCISGTERELNPFAHWEMQPSNLEAPESLGETQESSHSQFRAKLVVAADGINSTIRQVLYANTNLKAWAKPQYSGCAAIGCLQINDVPNSMIEELEVSYFQGDRMMTLSNDLAREDAQDLAQLRLIVVRKPDNVMGYLLHTPLNFDSLQNRLPTEIISLGIEVLKKVGFPSIFSELLSLSDPQKLIHRPYHIHPANIPVNAQPIWSLGRVVLVGDAAHGMPPFVAQGANQGLEDAALISTLITKIVQENCLDDATAIANEFSKYEQIRRPFMEKIQEATMTNNHWSQQQWDEYCEMVFSRNF